MVQLIWARACFNLSGYLWWIPVDPLGQKAGMYVQTHPGCFIQPYG